MRNKNVVYSSVPFPLHFCSVDCCSLVCKDSRLIILNKEPQMTFLAKKWRRDPDVSEASPLLCQTFFSDFPACLFVSVHFYPALQYIFSLPFHKNFRAVYTVFPAPQLLPLKPPCELGWKRVAFQRSPKQSSWHSVDSKPALPELSPIL